MISVVEPKNQQMERSRSEGASAEGGGDPRKPSASSHKTEKSGACSGDELSVPPNMREDAQNNNGGLIDIDRSSQSDAPHGESSGETSGEYHVSYEYAGTAAPLTSAAPAPPPTTTAMKSILRRHSSYGNTGKGETSGGSSASPPTSDSEEQTDRKPPAAAHADASAYAYAPNTSTSAAASRAPRRRSMLGVSYNGETAPLSGNDDGLGTATAAIRPAARTTARRHSMLGVAYNGMMAQLAAGGYADNGGSGDDAQGPWAPSSSTRRNSMLGVSYGAMTAPLSGDGGRSQEDVMAPSNGPSGPTTGPLPNPNKAHRRLSMPKTKVEGVNHSMSSSCFRGAERRLSMPRAEIGAASRETILSRSSSMAHSPTSSVIDQTRRPSLTEIQDFLDSDDDESSGDDDDDEVDLGGDGERRVAMPPKSERRLSMPRAEIGPSSRETIRSHSLTTMQIETRRLSLTEVQNYLDGDSSDEDEEDIHGSGSDTGNGGESTAVAAGAPDSQPVSPPSPSRRHSMASASSQASRPKSILRRHSSYGNSVSPGAPPQYVRPDLIRLASLQQQNTSSEADGNEVRRERSTSIGSAGSSVSFSSISVRSHKQTLGDHPCCHLGPPIALDWQYQDHQPVLVDDWERHRVRDSDNGSSANSERMYIPPHQRRNVLEYRYGHSREETTEAARVARMARRRRSMTRTMLPMAGIEEAGETVAGFAKKVVKSGRQVTKRKKANRRDSAHF